MSQYTEIMADGTRRVVKYNPHHDGPVSEYLTLRKRVSWLCRKVKRFPGDMKLKKRLADSSRQLNQISSHSPRVPSPPRQPHAWAKRPNPLPGKPLDQRKPEGSPLTVKSAPLPVVSQPVTFASAAAPGT